MQNSVIKKRHEIDVFAAFVAASCLPIPPESIRCISDNEGLPDISCKVTDKDQYFELTEIMWETSDEAGEAGCTLAKGLEISERRSILRSELVTQGKSEEARKLITRGCFEYPVLESVFQAIQRKVMTRYASPCSLLLYYERQTPIEPYEWLFLGGYRKTLTSLLTRATFDVVWLFDYTPINSRSLNAAKPEFKSLGASKPIPLSSLTTPEETRAIMGKIVLRDGILSMCFDAGYSATFSGALKELSRAMSHNAG